MSFTRRDFLGTSAAAASSLAVNAMAQTAQDTAKAEHDDFTKPAQQNPVLVKLNPDSDVPPPTDHGDVGPIWYSFDLAHRRIQQGGWTHQVTERELPLSRDIAGVNMRIDRGGFREAHWHLQDEWAIMLAGRARVTMLGLDGSMFVDEVQAGDLWIFPAGLPHSIQGIGEIGCEFLLVFNGGNFSEETTFLLSDWLKHTPPGVLQKNLHLGPESIAKLPKGEPLYIFPSQEPSQTLEQDRMEVARNAPKPKLSYTFKASTMTPTQTNAHGNVKIIDMHNFPASPKICAAIVTVKPGGLRELHWHPNGSEWQFWIKGKGRMTVFNAKQDARTMDFNPNDVGYVPPMAGHYIENTGTEDLVYLEMFASGEYQDLSLNNWLRSMPAQVTMAHTGLSKEELEKIPSKPEKLVG